MHACIFCMQTCAVSLIRSLLTSSGRPQPRTPLWRTFVATKVQKTAKLPECFLRCANSAARLDAHQRVLAWKCVNLFSFPLCYCHCGFFVLSFKAFSFCLSLFAGGVHSGNLAGVCFRLAQETHFWAFDGPGFGGPCSEKAEALSHIQPYRSCLHAALRQRRIPRKRWLLAVV